MMPWHKGRQGRWACSHPWTHGSEPRCNRTMAPQWTVDLRRGTSRAHLRRYGASPPINGSVPLNLALMKVWRKFVWAIWAGVWCFDVSIVSATAHLNMHVIPKIQIWSDHWSQEQWDAEGIHQRYSNEQHRSHISLKKSTHNSIPIGRVLCFIPKEWKKYIQLLYIKVPANLCNIYDIIFKQFCKIWNIHDWSCNKDIKRCGKHNQSYWN